MPIPHRLFFFRCLLIDFPTREYVSHIDTPLSLYWIKDLKLYQCTELDIVSVLLVEGTFLKGIIKRHTVLNYILLQASGNDPFFPTGTVACFQGDVPIALSLLNTYQMSHDAIFSLKKCHLNLVHCYRNISCILVSRCTCLR